MSRNLIHLTAPQLNTAKHCDLCGRMFAFRPARSTVCGTCLQDVAQWGHAKPKQSAKSTKRKVSSKENAVAALPQSTKPPVVVKKEQTMEDEFYALIADLSTVKDEDDSPPPPPAPSSSTVPAKAPVKSMPPPSSSTVSVKASVKSMPPPTSIPISAPVKNNMPPPRSTISISAPVKSVKKVKNVKKRKSEGEAGASSTKKQKRVDVKKIVKSTLSSAQIRRRVELLNTLPNRSMLGQMVPRSYRQAVWNVVQTREQDRSEYINASALYSALQTAATTKTFRFKGRHSLVSQPDIGKLEPRLRAEMVARDLKDLSGLSFTQLKTRGEDPEGGICLIYCCTCGKSANSARFEPDCIGVLRIQVQHDLTHPMRNLGLEGQRIEVEVNHP